MFMYINKSPQLRKKKVFAIDNYCKGNSTETFKIQKIMVGR